MKISLITPTHGTPYIIDTYKSIIAQTYDNWEWLILVNGTYTVESLPEEIRNDSRVVVHTDSTGNTNVGYLKNIAFHLATGDILAEMDHDDLLLPYALEKVAQVYEENPNVGFVWSDDIVLNENAPFVPYRADCGWTHSLFQWEGRDMIHMHGFETTSRSLAFIWYAPDHIRTWKADVYRQIGGHDQSLSILDDQDILARTYLVTDFHHIPEPLYVYRVTGDNTWLQRNQAIQTQTHEIFKKYAYALAEKDADKKGLIKVDIGGGLNPRPGYLTIDQEGADITCDLNDGIPLPDNSVGVLNASHVIEHLKEPLKTMTEIHRVLADGGWAFIDVPSTDGRGAWQDPTHVSFFNQNSFMYYTRKEQAGYIRNKTVKFQSFRLETHFPNNWYQANDIPVVTAWLCAVKSNDRRPHHLEF